MKYSISEPVITSHQFYALPLSIICSDENLRPWLYSEFVQWHTFRNREDERMHMRVYNNMNEMFKYEPLHETIILPKQLANGDNIIDVFKGILNEFQYIYDFVDSYYISADPRTYHCMHDLLIYGYDNDLSVLHAFAYQGDKLKKFDIPYEEYQTAYNSDYQKSQFHCTVLYRKKQEKYHPNIGRIGMHLMDYLNGVNTYNREFPLSVELYKPKFGLNVYKELKYNLQYMRQWHLSIDIPDMYCVYDHKRFMHDRIIYLDQNTELKCSDNLKFSFDEIEKVGRILIMLALKINQKKMTSDRDYDDLMQRFDVLLELEKRTYSEFYEYNHLAFENA